MSTVRESIGCDEALATESEAGVESCGELRINEIQVLGTHNSFHQMLRPTELAEFSKLDSEAADERSYSHPSIADQLEKLGVRDLEFDIFWDSKAAYTKPWVARAAGLSPDLDPAMSSPGIKVLHEQDVDYRSVCATLQICLAAVRDFSDTHPNHVPIALHLQFKDGPIIFAAPGAVVPERWTSETMDELDRLLIAELGRTRLITPDDVRGSSASLREAIEKNGWPRVSDSLGKVIVTMVDNKAQYYRSLYLVGHPELAGRVIFTQGTADSLAAETGSSAQGDVVYISQDDPLADAPISDWLARGFIVRTRSDDRKDRLKDPTVDLTERRDAALSSGAQFVVTDYAKGENAEEYSVELPGGAIARRVGQSGSGGAPETTVQK